MHVSLKDCRCHACSFEAGKGCIAWHKPMQQHTCGDAAEETCFCSVGGCRGCGCACCCHGFGCAACPEMRIGDACDRVISTCWNACWCACGPENSTCSCVDYGDRASATCFFCEPLSCAPCALCRHPHQPCSRHLPWTPPPPFLALLAAEEGKQCPVEVQPLQLLGSALGREARQKARYEAQPEAQARQVGES